MKLQKEASNLKGFYDIPDSFTFWAITLRCDGAVNRATTPTIKQTRIQS
jgi:hypothetical protein